MSIIGKLLHMLRVTKINSSIHEYVVYSHPVSIYAIYNSASNIDERIRLIQIGVDLVNHSTLSLQTVEEP